MSFPLEPILIASGLGCLVVGIVFLAVSFWFVVEFNEARYRRRTDNQDSTRSGP